MNHLQKGTILLRKSLLHGIVAQLAQGIGGDPTGRLRILTLDLLRHFDGDSVWDSF